MYFVMKPEVAGGLGPTTELSRDTFPPKASRLEYQFEGWLGDELITTFPFFLVTVRLAEAIRRASLTGCTFKPVHISSSDLLQELQPDLKLPEFMELQVHGSAGSDDFGYSADHLLVVSNRALQLIRKFGIDHADVSEYHS